MPALPPAPKVVRISYKFAIGEDLGAICREFYQYTGTAATAGELVTWANTIVTNFGTDCGLLMTPDRILELVTITDLSSPTSPEGVSTAGAAPGTRVGDPLPASAAVLISQKVLRRYRGGHPRTYWPFGASGDLFDSQKWTTAFQTAVGDALDTFYSNLVADTPTSMGGLQNCNVSYYEGFTVHMGSTGRARNISTPRLAPIIDLVTDFVVQLGVAQIRKRLLGLA